MEKKPKYQGRGGWRGGGRKKGVNQTSKTFRIDNTLLEFLASLENQNSFINKIISDYKDAENQKIGGLSIIQRQNKTFIQDIASGESFEIDNYKLELALRALF